LWGPLADEREAGVRVDKEEMCSEATRKVDALPGWIWRRTMRKTVVEVAVRAMKVMTFVDRAVAARRGVKNIAQKTQTHCRHRCCCCRKSEG
jgi:hypothetical protein